MDINSYTSLFFFFNDTATTEIYTLSLHDALPILSIARAPQVTELEEPIDHPRRAVGNFLAFGVDHELGGQRLFVGVRHAGEDRKSTRLNSSHLVISYAVFCLKKKKIRTLDLTTTY